MWLYPEKHHPERKKPASSQQPGIRREEASQQLAAWNMVDAATKKTLAAIPLLKTKAGPRDGGEWVTRLKEEYQALIKV